MIVVMGGRNSKSHVRIENCEFIYLGENMPVGLWIPS